MNFRAWLNENSFNLGEIPKEPGTTSIPPDHVRLYHYTRVNGDGDEARHAAAQAIKTRGILINQAKGSTYGEPNVVWASSQMPNLGKVFAEFSIHRDDPRWLQGKPEDNITIPQYQARNWNVYFRDSIKPNEIIAVHEPWHGRVRYILEKPKLTQEVKNGEFDHLLNTDQYGWAIRYVKSM